MKPEPKKSPQEVRSEMLERLKKFNNTVDDWRSVCRRCGAPRVGTLEDLRRACKACGNGS